jgi:hypothetical protein
MIGNSQCFGHPVFRNGSMAVPQVLLCMIDVLFVDADFAAPASRADPELV